MAHPRITQPGPLSLRIGICSDCRSAPLPLGPEAFHHFLGNLPQSWREHDATALIEAGYQLPALLVDQGLDDPFLSEQLHLDRFEAACQLKGQPLTYAAMKGTIMAITSSVHLLPIICITITISWRNKAVRVAIDHLSLLDLLQKWAKEQSHRFKFAVFRFALAVSILLSRLEFLRRAMALR